MHKFLFYNKFIIFLYMFRALCVHHQEVKITPVGSKHLLPTVAYRSEISFRVSGTIFDRKWRLQPMRQWRL